MNVKRNKTSRIPQQLFCCERKLIKCGPNFSSHEAAFVLVPAPHQRGASVDVLHVTFPSGYSKDKNTKCLQVPSNQAQGIISLQIGVADVLVEIKKKEWVCARHVVRRQDN